jgi:hypothetical protein
MALQNGWIKLHRKIIGTSVWEQSTAEQKAVLVSILLLASPDKSDGYLRGKIAKSEGQIVTTYQEIAEVAGKGCSYKKVRAAVEFLKRHDFLEAKALSGCGLLITVKKWAEYQSEKVGTKSHKRADQKDGVTNCNTQSCEDEENKKGNPWAGLRADQRADQRADPKEAVTSCNKVSSEGEENKQGQGYGQTKGQGCGQGQYNKKKEEYNNTPCSPPFEKTPFEKLDEWIDENIPELRKIKKQMTEPQYDKLRGEYTVREIGEVLQAMANTRGVEKKYQTVYLTVLNWLRYRNTSRK